MEKCAGLDSKFKGKPSDRSSARCRVYPAILEGLSEIMSRISLHALIGNPNLWSGAIIVSSHPGLTEPQERKQRLESDRTWANRFLHDEWESVIQAWNSQSVFKRSREVFVKPEQGMEQRDEA